jgi:hypothetical protein
VGVGTVTINILQSERSLFDVDGNRPTGFLPIVSFKTDFNKSTKIGIPPLSIIV